MACRIEYSWNGELPDGPASSKTAFVLNFGVAVKAKKLARPITLSEFEIDPDEWKRIRDESATVRLLEGGKKIAGKEESFYDNEIMKNITGEWQKAWRALGNTLHRMKIKTGIYSGQHGKKIKKTQILSRAKQSTIRSREMNLQPPNALLIGKAMSR